MFKNLKIGMKLALGFGLVLFISSIISVFGIIAMNKINNNNTMLFTNPMAVNTAALEANANLLGVERADFDALLAKNENQLEDAINEADTYYRKAMDNFMVIQERYLGDKDEIQDALTSVSIWYDFRQEIIDMIRNGKGEQAEERMRNEGLKLIDEMDSKMLTIINSSRNRAEDYYRSSNADAVKSTALITTLTIFSIIIGVLSAFFIIKSIANPITKLNTIVDQAAHGDLTVEYQGNLKSKDEITQLIVSFNIMVSNLRNLSLQVLDSANLVAATSQELMAGSETATAASEEISFSTQAIIEGSENQNRHIAEIVTMLSELATGSEQTATNMQDMANEAHLVNDLSIKGKKDLEQVIVQMNHISEVSTQAVEKVIILQNKSNDIEGIIGVIEEISSQTNLLALNAAIEAARAGEEGKGFAVVADEIRNLAEKTDVSTKNITILINEIKDEINDVIKAISTEEEDVRIGLEKVDLANSSFENILNEFKQIVSLVEDESAVTQEMSASTQQAAASIKEIAQVSEDNTASVEGVTAAVEEQTATMEEITASATGLAEMSIKLTDIINKFKIQ